MRRKDIQLLAETRRGNIPARLDVGRRYLTGSDSFQRHVATGLEYLSHPSVRTLPEVANIIAESLPLEELLEFKQMESLGVSAAANNPTAQFKLAIWRILSGAHFGPGLDLLEQAYRGGFPHLLESIQILRQSPNDQGLVRFLRGLNASSLDQTKVIMIAAQESLTKKDIQGAARSLRLFFQLTANITDEMTDVLFAAVRLAEHVGEVFSGFPPAIVQECLEHKCNGLDYSGSFILGRALCGIDCGSLTASSLVRATNFRRGAALLLRAADQGEQDAWFYLYNLHSNHELSVANPEMARFCLEKAAHEGKVSAQRRLGVQILRESKSLSASEVGIEWLSKAWQRGDKIAWDLMASLVLPNTGKDTEANNVIAEIARQTPWLSIRLRLSRDFGLTKTEALTVNPYDGLRTWGLVVGQNSFIIQKNISAPRAIPALSEQKLINLRTAAEFFAQVKRDGDLIEGDLRHRLKTQRTTFKRHHLDEQMFFSEATSVQLNALRHGAKWAYRNPQLIAIALEAP